MVRRVFSVACFILFVVLAPTVAAQCVSLTTLGSVCTQNFDTRSSTGTITASTADSDTRNNSATATSTVSVSAGLQISETVTPNSVTAGSNLSYTITLNNVGPSQVASVALTDSLPAGTMFVSLAPPGGWTCTTPAVGAAGTVSCNIANLAMGSASFTLVTKVDDSLVRGTILTNSATATSVAPDPPPPVTAAASATVLAPELTAFSSLSPRVVAPGQSFSGITFGCRNIGTANATDVRCTPGAGPGTMSRVVCTPSVPVASLAPGEVVQCTYDFTAPGMRGGRDEPEEIISFGGATSASNLAVYGNLGGLFSYSYRERVLDAVDDGPTVLLNDAAQTVNVLANDSLGVGAGIPPGEVEATADGAVTCVGCTSMPTALVVSSDGTVTVPALAVPGTYRVPYRICVPNPAPFAAACDTAVATIIVQGADIVSTIACTPTPATEGTPIACTATCINNGPATALNAVCGILNVASLPASASAPVCASSPAATLAPGRSLTCTVRFQMPSAGNVTVSGGGGADNDPVGGTSPSAVGNSVSATLLLLSNVAIPTLGAYTLIGLALMLAACGYVARRRGRRA